MLMTEKYRGPDLIGGCKDLGFACKNGKPAEIFEQKTDMICFWF